MGAEVSLRPVRSGVTACAEGSSDVALERLLRDDHHWRSVWTWVDDCVARYIPVVGYDYAVLDAYSSLDSAPVADRYTFADSAAISECGFVADRRVVADRAIRAERGFRTDVNAIAEFAFNPCIFSDRAIFSEFVLPPEVHTSVCDHGTPGYRDLVPLLVEDDLGLGIFCGHLDHSSL